MATFVLLSKVSSEGAKQVKSLARMDEEFDRQLRKHCPEVRRLASYALLVAYDFLHIFEAPDEGGDQGSGPGQFLRSGHDPDADGYTL